MCTNITYPSSSLLCSAVGSVSFRRKLVHSLCQSVQNKICVYILYLFVLYFHFSSAWILFFRPSVPPLHSFTNEKINFSLAHRQCLGNVIPKTPSRREKKKKYRAKLIYLLRWILPIQSSAMIPKLSFRPRTFKLFSFFSTFFFLFTFPSNQ